MGLNSQAVLAQIIQYETNYLLVIITNTICVFCLPEIQFDRTEERRIIFFLKAGSGE